MCNLYSITRSQDAMRRLFAVAHDGTGNLPPLPGVFPKYPAPIVRMADGERELTMMRRKVPDRRFFQPTLERNRNRGQPKKVAIGKQSMPEKLSGRSSYYLKSRAGVEAFVSSDKPLQEQTLIALLGLTLLLSPPEAVGKVEEASTDPA